MNQSETDLGIVNESQLLGFGISGDFRHPVSASKNSVPGGRVRGA
jgi:hypothetical protein